MCQIETYTEYKRVFFLIIGCCFAWNFPSLILGKMSFICGYAEWYIRGLESLGNTTISPLSPDSRKIGKVLSMAIRVRTAKTNEFLKIFQKNSSDCLGVHLCRWMKITMTVMVFCDEMLIVDTNESKDF